MNDSPPTEPQTPNLGIIEQALAWLPMILLFAGGGIGGAIGVLGLV